MTKARDTGNLVSSNSIYVDIATDRVGIGTTNPTSKLTVSGEIFLLRENTTQEGGQITFARALDDISAYSIDCYNDSGQGTLPRLRFIDNIAGAERASLDKSGNFIVGSGTSTGTISQPLQVTGGAYVSGNLGVGTTNPTAKLHVGGGTTIANTAPLEIESGSLLTTVEANTFEYDGALFYHTANDTANGNGRALIPEFQFVRRTGDLSISDTTSPGTSVFGSTTRPALLAGNVYSVEIEFYITKVTNNGTVTVQVALSTGNFTFATLQNNTAGTAVVVGGTTSPVTVFTSASLTAGVSYGFITKGLVQPVSNSRLDVLLYSSTTSVTALSGTNIKVFNTGTSATIGNIA